MKYNRIIILALSITSFAGSAFAQDKDVPEDDLGNKKVTIIRPYDPSISDANKISKLPKLVDTAKVEAQFKYAIESKPLFSDYELTPIRPVKMQPEMLKKLYNSFVRLGYGNYNTAYGEVYYNTLRSKTTQFGVHLKHYSSSGKQKVEDNDKVYTGFNDDFLNVYGKRFYKSKTLKYYAGYEYNTSYYYGIDTTLAATDDYSDKKENTDKQVFNIINGGLQYKTNYTDSTMLNYKINANGYFVKDFFSNSETGVELKGIGTKYYEKELLGVDARLTFNSQQLEITGTSVDYFIGHLSPWGSMRGDNWKIKVGLTVNALVSKSDNIKYYLFPRAEVRYEFVPDIMFGYISMDGNYDANTYKEIIKENPFITPGLVVSGSKCNLKLNAGVKGNFTNKIAYHINGEFASIDDMYFYTDANFIGDSIGVKGVRYDVVYDDVQIIRVKGEVDYAYSDKLGFILAGGYNSYVTSNIEKAWHMPDYEVMLSAKYNLQKKIYANLEVFAIGERYAMNAQTNSTGEYNTLSAIVDVNLGLEYRYSKRLGAYVKVNNIANQTYYKYDHYPMQKLNFLGGITFSF